MGGGGRKRSEESMAEQVRGVYILVRGGISGRGGGADECAEKAQRRREHVIGRVDVVWFVRAEPRYILLMLRFVPACHTLK